MNDENETIIKALNKYGRVPQQYELLNEIDKLQEKINKAIEYIEERKTLNWYADGVFVYELLNILQEVK